MLIKKPEIPSSEITPKETYPNRRKFLAGAALTGAAALTGIALRRVAVPSLIVQANDKIPGLQKSPLSTTEKQTPYKDVTNYNNFYEFSTDKYEPAELAKNFKTHPWKVTIDGQVAKKLELDVNDIIKWAAPEERIYRHRCVEGWSIVVPWIGFSFNELIKRAQPTNKAKYVEFTTLWDPKQMPGQRIDVLKWPYVEGLRLDEAMHPLTLLSVGMYGETLPNQDGAPVRMVIPWKYGFKSIKSLVKIRFVKDQPPTTWNISNAHEYGFYSNVNPTVDHPRWSQAHEHRLGGGLFDRPIPTLMFNGYADQVAGLYSGMDLKKYY